MYFKTHGMKITMNQNHHLGEVFFVTFSKHLKQANPRQRLLTTGCVANFLPIVATCVCFFVAHLGGRISPSSSMGSYELQLGSNTARYIFKSSTFFRQPVMLKQAECNDLHMIV